MLQLLQAKLRKTITVFLLYFLPAPYFLMLHYLSMFCCFIDVQYKVKANVKHAPVIT
jgi:hypothetical protein